jgi:hypothetical protein
MKILFCGLKAFGTVEYYENYLRRLDTLQPCLEVELERSRAVEYLQLALDRERRPPEKGIQQDT